MANPISAVRAGDLIRADEYNLLIATVNDLLNRVVTLEAGGTTSTTGAPVVDAVNPVTPKLFDTVVVTGRFFDYSIGAARVSVDGLDCPLLGGSSDTSLIFLMPGLASVPPSGRVAELLVQNLRLSTSRSILVLPDDQPPDGDVKLDFQGTKPDRITLNQPCTFFFEAVSTSNQNIRMNLLPTVSVAAWRAGLTIVDDAGVTLAGGDLTIPAGKRKDFGVRIAMITSAATTFSLTVNGQGNGITTTSGARSFNVGQLGTQDKETDLEVETVVRGGAGPEPYDKQAQTITLKVNEAAEVRMNARFRQIGKSQLTGTKVPSTSAWTLADLPIDFDVKAADIPDNGPSAGWATKSEPFVVTAPTNAGTTRLDLVLKRANGTDARTLSLTLVAQP